MYGFTKGEIPYPYEAVDWQMRLERVPSDYGQPERPYGVSWAEIEDLERNEDYLNGGIF